MPLHGAFDLPGAGADGGDTVCHAQTEVIVAMDADHGLVNVGDVVEDAGYEVVELLRGGVSNRVRDVYGAGTGVDHRLQDPVEVVPVGAGGVHGGELDIAEVSGGAAYHLGGQLEYLLVVLLELVHEVDV